MKYIRTKDKEFCFHDIFADKGGYKPLYYLDNREHDNWSEKLNGKVVAMFSVRKVGKIYSRCLYLRTTQLSSDMLALKSCLNGDKLREYLNGKDGYAYHIEDLVIFDEPKRLCNFRSTKVEYDEIGKPYHPFIKNAPQNFVFVESEE